MKSHKLESILANLKYCCEYDDVESCFRYQFGSRNYQITLIKEHDIVIKLEIIDLGPETKKGNDDDESIRSSE
jgi:hypothetical protein